MIANYNFLFTLLLAISIGINHLSANELRIVAADQHQTTLQGAHVKLRAPDGAVSFDKITDFEGIARFSDIQNGDWEVHIRYLGFEPLHQMIRVTEAERQFLLHLKPDVVNLAEVTISGSRSFLRQEGDRLILDPEALAGISTNALELIETVPGLFVDPQGGVFLSSATPAAIYINGREQRMNPQDIMAVLRSLPPNSIQRIEIIRNPSARYEASSSGGIINIVLKRGVNLGRYGSVNTGMNQGIYGNRFGGFSLNQGSQRSSWYLHANYAGNGHEEEVNQMRSFQNDNLLNQSTTTLLQSRQMFTGFGAGYQLNEKWSMNYDGRINTNHPNSSALSETHIEIPGNLQQAVNHTSNKSKLLNLNQDIGITLQIDTLGSSWDTRVGYTWDSGNVRQHYNTIYFSPGPEDLTGQGKNRYQRNLFQVQTDLNYRFGTATMLEAGLKGDFQDYNSRANYSIQKQGEWMDDTLRIHAYKFRETILSAYIEASHELPGNIQLKAGLRIEDYEMRGQLETPLDTGFVSRQTELFPYLYLSRSLWKAAGYEFRGYFIARRSVTRPDYQNLTPHNQYVSPWFYQTGNPGLKPQFTQNFEANISFDDIPIFAIGRSHTRNVFTNIMYQDDSTEERTISTYDNVGERQETYFRMVGALPPGRKYFFVLGTQYNKNEYKGMYGDEPIIFKRGSWQFFTMHSLRVTANTRIIMFAFYMLNGQLNFFETGNFGQLNISINQSFLDNRLHITLSGRDVLRTMQQNFRFNQGTLYLEGDRYSDNQRIGLSIRYQFGIRKQEEKQNLLKFDMGE